MQCARLNRPHDFRVQIATLAMTFLATIALSLALAVPVIAATLDRVRETGKLVLGYRTDGRPFSYKDESGNAAGYAVALCKEVAEQVKSELGLPTLTVEWIPVTIEDQFQAVKENKVDLLCGAAETLTTRKEVDFSVPIFPGGIGALLRASAPAGLKEVLSGRPPSGPLWRGYPAQIIEKQKLSAVEGPGEKWLKDKLSELQLTAEVVPVKSYDEGIQRVLDGSSDVFFADRSILLDAVKRGRSADELVVVGREFTYAPIAFALERGDPDFRLVVDRVLSQISRSEKFHDLYVKWFGKPDQSADTFFRLSTLPE
jgi:ABC-type amino acid transport substrate-binding protein